MVFLEIPWPDLTSAIIIELIVAAVIGIIIWFFREKAIHIIRFFSYRIFNKNARIKAIHIRKYNKEPKVWLSCKIFDELREKITTDEITKKKVSNENMIIHSKNLGSTISICIDPEFDLSTIDSSEPKIVGYKVAIELENEIRLGLRNVDELDNFQVITDYGHEIIQRICFSNNQFFENYMIFDLDRENKFYTKGKTKIVDTQNNAEISIIDDKLEICLSEPKHFLKVVKKYFIL